MKPPRILFPKSLILVTTRVEEGLPFIGTPELNAILLGILARAQYLYPIKICAFIFMGNHLHMLILVQNPEDVPAFMRRIKTEIAHFINRKLGRRRRTVWCAGYDAVPILTLESAIEKFVYLYTNPQSAHLVSEIKEFSGVSSWGMLVSGEYSILYTWQHREAGGNLPDAKNQSKEPIKQSYPLTISPDEWLYDVFLVPREEHEDYLQKIITSVKERERELVQKRSIQKIKVLGTREIPHHEAHAFKPRKFSKRMWCICKDQSIRINFIYYVKSLIAQAREVYENWKLGIFSKNYPPPLFAPRMPRRVNMIPISVQTFA